MTKSVKQVAKKKSTKSPSNGSPTGQRAAGAAEAIVQDTHLTKENTRAIVADASSSPEKALAYLPDFGMLNADGTLASKYNRG